jgi:hypothetical protein
MKNFDIRILRLWAAVTVGALITLFLPGLLWMLLISVIGIPIAFILSLMPNAWIYLTIALLFYGTFRLVWRQKSPVTMLVVAAIPPLVAGFLVPILANDITDERVARIMADDYGSPPTLPRGLSIVFANDWRSESQEKCWEICQRLLFSQTAKSFVQVPLDKVPVLASLTKSARRFSLGPIGPACNNSRLEASYSRDEEAGNIRPPPLLWDKLPELARQGLCVHDDAVRDTRADVLVIDQWNYDPGHRGFAFDGAGWQLTLHPIVPFTRQEVLRRTPTGWKRLMRRTAIRYAHLAVPLRLVPGGSFDTTWPTHWEWDDFRPSGKRMWISNSKEVVKWDGILDNDLTVKILR